MPLARAFSVVVVSFCLASVASGQDRLSSPLSVDDCITIALENNQKRTVSRLALDIAEAQHGQAVSAYWPQVDLQGSAALMDDDPLFTFPEETSTYTIGGLGPQPIPAAVTIPDKQVKLLNKSDLRSSLAVTLPLYTGGKRRGIVQQASAGVAAAREGVRKTDLEVTYDVTRYYYGVVLARRLAQTAEEALLRLEVTLELTENLYLHGSGKVNKTDFLKHKMVVESLRVALAALEARADLASAALAHAMGLSWDDAVQLSETEIPFYSGRTDLGVLVGDAYRNNPDWGMLEAGIRAAQGRIREARSGSRPRLAAQGELQVIANDYDAGIVGPDQKKSWRVSLGLQIPLFNGFRTRSAVREAVARLDQMTARKVLLKEGLGLQVKHLHRAVTQAQAQETAARAALDAAEENRDLNLRAYQDQLVEVEDVIQSQIMESFAIAQYEKIRFDQVVAIASLEKVIGQAIEGVASAQ